mmetsp:Transcript_47438/g.110684  ORF Transcript_47438/g.110684 Transcript_47438/m.110684 type:complete len:119 (+) Transcript_47438:30-386(+)
MMRGYFFAAVVALVLSTASAFQGVARCAAPRSAVQMATQDFSGKKYGVPVFLPSGNVNPAYLAAERKAKETFKKSNFAKFEKIKAKQIAKKTYDIADFIKIRIGMVNPPGYFPGKGGL